MPRSDHPTTSPRAGCLVHNAWASVRVAVIATGDDFWREERHGMRDAGALVLCVDPPVLVELMSRCSPHILHAPDHTLFDSFDHAKEWMDWLNVSSPDHEAMVEAIVEGMVEGKHVWVVSSHSLSAPLVLVARALCRHWGISGKQAMAYLAARAPFAREAVSHRCDRTPFHAKRIDLHLQRALRRIPESPTSVARHPVPHVARGTISHEAWHKVTALIDQTEEDEQTVFVELCKFIHKKEWSGRGYTMSEDPFVQSVFALFLRQPYITLSYFLTYLTMTGDEDVFSNPNVVFWFANGLSYDERLKIWRYLVGRMDAHLNEDQVQDELVKILIDQLPEQAEFLRRASTLGGLSGLVQVTQDHLSFLQLLCFLEQAYVRVARAMSPPAPPLAQLVQLIRLLTQGEAVR